MSRLWSPFVNSLQPYVPGEQPSGGDIVKLNTNENPYPPSPAVHRAIAGLAEASLRLYPDPESQQLRGVIADYHSSGEKPFSEHNVFVGNGSDEVLAHAFNAFFRQPRALLFPDITYSFYPVYCELYGVEYRTVALNEAYQLEVDDYCRGQAGGIIFANPNAPTGILLDVASVAKIAGANPEVVVIVDEAYIDFATDEKNSSAIRLVNEHNNILVVRTLSKSRSLAGIRLGYALGHADLIEGLNRVKNSFNSYPIDRLAEVAALASFADEGYFQQRRRAVIEQREKLLEKLEKLGFNCLPSAANFVMVRHAGVSGSGLADALRERDVIVRYFDKPRLDQYLRITVGNSEQNDALISALSDILA